MYSTTASFNTTSSKTMITVGEDDSFMIALYYCYTPKPITDCSKHRSFQSQICEDLDLKGRVRVSSEGINGVLSGRRSSLESYERILREELIRLMTITSFNQYEEAFYHGGTDTVMLGGRHYGEELDVKYCHLRKDIPLESQLFQSLSVKSTKEVISLIGQPLDPSAKKKGTWRRRQIRNSSKNPAKPKSNCSDNHIIAVVNDQATDDNGKGANKDDGVALEQIKYHHHLPAQHLSPEKWNELLHSFSKDIDGDDKLQCHPPANLAAETVDEDEAIIIDARNIYESRLGHFKVPGVKTILTNTRKYSSLPTVLDASIPHLAGKNVFMYCTGGVRCERASMYLQALAETDRWGNHLKPKAIYQLEGGIQRYLEIYGSTNDSSLKTDDNDKTNNNETILSTHALRDKNKSRKETNVGQDCLFKGRNFVFDPRRTDPVMGPDSPSRCILCTGLHHDYDNGHAPSENRESRCCRCRILVLVCNNCRSTFRVWGENPGEYQCTETGSMQPKLDLFCGPLGKACIDEGNSLENVEIIV